MASPTVEALPGQVRTAVIDFARRVRDRFGPRVREVVLYGSQARGDQGDDSDIDVFVCVEGLAERELGDVFDLAADVSLEHDVTLQAFAPLPAEHEFLVRNECRIVLDIAAEGIAL